MPRPRPQVKASRAAAEPDMPPPHPLLALTEAHRVVAEVMSLRLSRDVLKQAPRGDGHAVVVLPGFMGADGYSAAMRRFLASRNYAVHGWGQGRNLGPRQGVLEALEARIESLNDHYGEPVSLVGHSLGGIYARELGRIAPERIRQVISLGSPFGKGRRSGSYPARLFAALNPQESLPIEEDTLHEAPPVPTTAIYSREDGVVNWRTAVQTEGHAMSQSIRVPGSHCGMTLNPTIWYLLAQVLAQPRDEWRPFQPGNWARMLYSAEAGMALPT